MKKSLFIPILYFFCMVSVSAQFSISGVPFVPYVQSDIDAVFVVDGTDDASLSYQLSENNDITWSYYDADGNKTLITSELNVSESSIPLQNTASVGYELLVGSDALYVWVFNYPDFETELNSILIDTNVEDRCLFIQAQLNISADDMPYQMYNQATSPYKVVRTYELAYDSAYFAETNYETESVIRTIALTPQLQLTSPLINTTYTLTGDQFAKAFNREKTLVSDELEAFAVEIHPQAKIQTRDGLNEKERDVSSLLTLRGSAPLEIEVLSYANVPVARNFEWCLSREADFSPCELAYIDKDFRYSLNQQIRYYLRLQVFNNDATCTADTSYIIDVVDSFLEVPNTFTPNGDGRNDEFRVAYKSLIQFSGKIYDRWGRLIFSWTEPTKGWDGTINGVEASEGAYFYYIEATGVDRDEKGELIEYRKKGDINLLR
ncbi:MAG: gliding motility-associated C-terminal domain-containing protein [Paludibacteraceae bacterium]|nr:gliding motility-associated C-terminal domain-containing protein [Paludibacteraceae bacterium]MBP6285209.1 gliding motility-associated C-terminal domain-containing protein [Paludibacteraceae bacterium]